MIEFYPKAEPIWVDANDLVLHLVCKYGRRGKVSIGEVLNEIQHYAEVQGRKEDE